MDVRGPPFFFFFDLNFLCALFFLFLFLSAFFDLAFRARFVLERLSSFNRLFPLFHFFPTASSLPTTHFCLYKKQGFSKERNPLRPPLLPPRHTSHPRQHPHHDALNDSVHGELSGRTRTRTFTFSAPSFSLYNYKA